MPTMRFKSEEVDEFLKQNKGGNKLLSNYLEYPTYNLGTSRIKVNLLKYPYRDFSCRFSRILGLESTMFVTRNVVYGMNYALHEKYIIYWGYIISIEIYFQLNNLKNNH